MAPTIFQRELCFAAARIFAAHSAFISHLLNYTPRP